MEETCRQALEVKFIFSVQIAIFPSILFRHPDGKECPYCLKYMRSFGMKKKTQCHFLKKIALFICVKTKFHAHERSYVTAENNRFVAYV